MVRVFIKGGVWKNSEDEILKAAVMKYGKHQWARVASLLNRKSAKQCKARWNEWLDPSVKKVEWSREEEEKLLHLAKLMPSQWKTIAASLEGRTAIQCQEHYERLLDEAALSNQQSQGDTANAASSEALRRHTLRPGDIDSHPETKPARPDPIDMDEDEIEMLQEARARLANTQGKKAKRKQREKMLNEAKRLADLQKRRELKQAGLLSSAMRKKNRNKREIDLGVEIPFHKPAPAGFHDVSVEREKVEDIRVKRLKSVNLKEVNEAQYRSRDREAALSQKKEEARLRSLERANAALAIATVSKKSDPISERNRGLLVMPEPQVKEDELRQVVKLAKQQESMLMPPPPSRAMGVTDALLGDYSDRPLPTTVRTPLNQSVPSRANSILKEASQLREREQGQTPLLNAVHNTEDEDDDEVDDMAHNTNNNIEGSVAASMSTPQFERAIVDQTPLNLAPRDELGLNPHNQNGDSVSVASSAFLSTIASTTIGGRSIKEIAREERRAAKRARLELQLALKNLPAPQFEYELSIPDAPLEDTDEEKKKSSEMVLDASHIEKLELEKLRKEAEQIYERQSTVLKRKDLPRPSASIQLQSKKRKTSSNGNTIQEYVNMYDEDVKDDESNIKYREAAKLVSEEMMTLVQHDVYAHPPETNFVETSQKKKKKKEKKTTKQKKAKPVVLEHISDENLQIARGVLESEAKALMEEQIQAERLSLMKKSSTSGEIDVSQTDAINSLFQRNINSSVENASSRKMLYLDTSEEYEEDQNPKWINTTTNNEKPSFTKSERLKALTLQFTALKSTSEKLQSKTSKLKSKLGIKLGGYTKRASDLSDGILHHFAQLQHLRIEESVYGKLEQTEEKAMESRRDKSMADLSRLKDIKERLKGEYESKLALRDELWVDSKKKEGSSM